jgi:2'-5' RNA ligase
MRMKIGSHNGMIAIYPNIEFVDRLSKFCDSEYDASDLHLTLFYSSKLGEMSEQARNALVSSIRKRKPFYIELTGDGTFYPDVKGDKYVKVLLFTSIEMDELQNEMYEILKADGLVQSGAYGFVPHMTLGYVDESKAKLGGMKRERASLYVRSVYIVFGRSKPERIDLEG